MSEDVLTFVPAYSVSQFSENEPQNAALQDEVSQDAALQGVNHRLDYRSKLEKLQRQKDERDRAKANSVDVDGPYTDLAVEVRRILGYSSTADRPFLNSRRASEITEINSATISKMVRGHKTGPKIIRRFAEALGADAEILLEAASRPYQTKDGLNELGNSVAFQELEDWKAGKGQIPELIKEIVELPTSFVDIKPSLVLLKKRNARKKERVISREWTHCIQLFSHSLDNHFIAGDVILMREDTIVRNGVLAVARLNGRLVAGYFLHFLDCSYEVDTKGRLTPLEDDFVHLGVITGYVREANRVRLTPLSST